MRTVLSLTVFFFLSLALRVKAQDLSVVKDSEPAQHLVANVEMQPQSFYPTHLQDWVVVVGTSVTVVGVLLGGWKGLAEWNRSTKQREEETKQREREFRHKQAVYAREITNEVFNDSRARAALEMLDWLRKKFKTEDGEIVLVERSKIQVALRAPGQAKDPTTLTFSKVEAFIRTRFEALYDRLEEIEKLVNLEIINFQDLETVFRYYMIRALRPEIQHAAFLDYYDYPNAKAFLNRFANGTKQGSWLSPSALEDDNIAASETPIEAR
jgi:hypothetical protein